MNPYFKMRNYADKDGLQQIQLIFSVKGKVLKLDTGVKTKPEYWTGMVEGKKQKRRLEGMIISRCSEIKQDQNTLNIQLDNAMKKLKDIIVPYRTKYLFSPDIEFVKERFYSEEMKIDKAQDVRRQLYLWIPEKNKKHGVKLYSTLLHDLIDMSLTRPVENWKKISNERLDELLKKGKPLLFSQVTNKFKEDYIRFLESRKTKRLGKVDIIQYSTINKRFQALKAFLNAMADKGINEFDYYKKFKTELDEIGKQPVIIPRPKEFVDLLNADLSDYPRYDYARTIFILGCLTGLRFGDLTKISNKNVVLENGKRYIITDVSKTREKQIRIPLHDIAYQLILKYEYYFKITNQDLNRNLHDMFEHLRFNRQVTRYEKRAKDSIPIDLPFYQLVTMHSSRRFFISTLVNSKKVSLGNIMKWSRHKTEVIMSYIEEGYEEEQQMREVFSAFES